MQHVRQSRKAALWAVLTLVGAAALVAALPAAAVDPDVTPPVLGTATLTPTAADGNSNWRRTPPTLNLSATDDTAVQSLQYSLDGGTTYLDVTITPGPSVSGSATISQEGNTSVRYRATDSSGNLAPSPTTTTTINVAAAVGATGIRVASTTGRTVGEKLYLGTGADQELIQIASIPSPAPASPNPNLILTAPLTKAHPTTSPGNGVFATFRTITVQFDDQPPVAAWNGVVADKILQSATLTPTLSDPRRQFPGDTANGSGGTAYWTMTTDGVESVPKSQPLNRFAVGPHAQTVTIQDVAGNRITYTRNFVVTTSFADLDAVLTQYANNALSTTLNGATVVGATGLRLSTPFGFRVGQTILIGPAGPTQETATITAVPKAPPTVNTTLANAAPAGTTDIRLSANIVNNGTPIVVAGAPIVIDTGANQELVYAKTVVTPAPAAPAANVILTKPLAMDHGAGTATTLVNVVLDHGLTQAHATGAATPVVNPRPFLPADQIATLRSLLTSASTAAANNQTAGAIDYLKQFNSFLQSDATPAGATPAERQAVIAALSTAGRALIDQVKGKPVDTSTAGTTLAVQAPFVRQFWDPHPPTPVAGAAFKVLVNARTGSGQFRHENVVDQEALIQYLGEQNGFDVDIWDPSGGGTSPGRAAPAGVSLTTNPFSDINLLRQYKVVVFDSTVGRPTSASLSCGAIIPPNTSVVCGADPASEFNIFQQWYREGNGVVATHGGTDAYQAVPWYMDLVGAGFTNHGSNSTGGIMPDCGACGEVRYTNADPGSAINAALPLSQLNHDELYNYNRDPVDLGIVHPLLMEDESTLVGQLNYSPGPLENTDRHGMIWCRNFDGGRSYTNLLAHSWLVLYEDWFRQNLLHGIQFAAGTLNANCVTFVEVSDLLAAAVAAGNVNANGADLLGTPLSTATEKYQAGDYARARAFANEFVKQTERPANCRNAVGICPDGGAALGKLHAKGLELVNWMDGL